jgi:hypothetical protein
VAGKIEFSSLTIGLPVDFFTPLIAQGLSVAGSTGGAAASSTAPCGSLRAIWSERGPRERHRRAATTSSQTEVVQCQLLDPPRPETGKATLC